MSAKEEALVPYGDPNWYQGWNSIYFNESHHKLRQIVREFVEKEIMPHVHEWSEKNQVPAEVRKKAYQLGILGSMVPYSPHVVIGGITFEDYMIGISPIALFGTDYLKEKVIQPCMTGEKVICLCITEPGAGSDVANLATEAKKTEDGKHYVVNGVKKWITNGAFADYFTVAVRTGEKGYGGISLLLLERGMKGLNTKTMPVQGVWGSGTSYVTFEDVLVPVENLIGEENEGFKYIMYNFNRERYGLIVMSNRFARVCYEEAFRYAHKRKTFGKRLIDHPVIRNKLANMARHIEATHAWIESITYQMTTMDRLTGAKLLFGPIALLKVQATTTFEYCAREASQVFGGLAYSRGGQGEKVERLYRDVRAMAIGGGSEEVMLDLAMRQASRMAKL